MTTARVVLASGSPRRLDLLRSIGIEPSVVVPDVDETPLEHEQPRALVERLAATKAATVNPADDSVVVAADTIVVLDGEILGKPVDDVVAAATLRRLSGRTHEVLTAVAVRTSLASATRVVTTRVEIVDLDQAMIDWYVATGEPLDKAGSYAIQGAGGGFVVRVDGSASNVVGLPLAETLAMLDEVGHPADTLRA